MGGKVTSYHFGVCSEMKGGRTFAFAALSLPLSFTNLLTSLSWIQHLFVIFGIQMTWQGEEMPTSLNEGRGEEGCG